MKSYPAGVTQASFDRETERLNEPTSKLPPVLRANDPEAFTRLEMALHPEWFISKRDAAKIVRVMMRLQEQVDRAASQGRHRDANALCRIIGGALFRQCGFDGYAEEL